MTRKASPRVFLLWWMAATALGWLLAHRMLQLYVLEAAWLAATVGVPAVALVSFVRALRRRRRKADPRWRAIPIDAGRALIVVFALVVRQAGSIAGVLQWPVLGRHISGGAWWGLAGGLGSFIGVNLGRRISGASEPFYLAVEGAAVGLLQWIVLRREVQWAGWWIAASALGWLVGGLAIAPVWNLWHAISGEMTGRVALLAYYTVPWAFGGLVCGIATGVPLWMLLRKRRPGR